MNKGVWLSSARKIVLTGINFGIICIALIVVSLIPSEMIDSINFEQ